MARFRIQRNREFLIFAGNTTLGWRRVGCTSLAEGEKKVEAGVWRRIYDELLNHVGYQPLGAERSSDEELDSMPSCPVISIAEMEAVAGTKFKEGGSRTYGLHELQRMERIAKKLAPEDEVERAIAKVRVWGQLGSAAGDVLRVWPK